VTITQTTEAAIVPIAGDDDVEQQSAAPYGEPAGDGSEQPDAEGMTSAEAESEPAIEAALDIETSEIAEVADIADVAEHVEPAVRPDRTRTPRVERSGGGARRSSGGAAAHDRRTTAQRLGNFPRADKPAPIPAPEHHHLPGWVRRDFARARPPLSNLLALLEGDAHDQFAKRIAELTEGISSGKFSLAWQYPDLVDEGRTLYDKQRRESAESARANRQLDTARRRVLDRVRDAGDGLAPEVSARLQRQLRSATDSDAINVVNTELDGVLSTARSSADKRREREIERTKARIMRSAAAAGAAEATPQAETWQDVLRRFAEEQAAGSRASE